MDDAQDPQSEPLGFEEAVPEMVLDPWVRFDMWASRSWEMSQNAVVLANELGPRDADSVDDRIIAMFHAAGIASKFAEITNPINNMAVESSGVRLLDGDEAALVARLFTDPEE